jgi:hypothetical protein
VDTYVTHLAVIPFQVTCNGAPPPAVPRINVYHASDPKKDDMATLVDYDVATGKGMIRVVDKIFSKVGAPRSAKRVMTTKIPLPFPYYLSASVRSAEKKTTATDGVYLVKAAKKEYAETLVKMLAPALHYDSAPSSPPGSDTDAEEGSESPEPAAKRQCTEGAVWGEQRSVILTPAPPTPPVECSPGVSQTEVVHPVAITVTTTPRVPSVEYSPPDRPAPVPMTIGTLDVSRTMVETARVNYANAIAKIQAAKAAKCSEWQAAEPALIKRRDEARVLLNQLEDAVFKFEWAERQSAHIIKRARRDLEAATGDVRLAQESTLAVSEKKLDEHRVQTKAARQARDVTEQQYEAIKKELDDARLAVNGTLAGMDKQLTAYQAILAGMDKCVKDLDANDAAIKRLDEERAKLEAERKRILDTIARAAHC